MHGSLCCISKQFSRLSIVSYGMNPGSMSFHEAMPYPEGIIGTGPYCGYFRPSTDTDIINEGEK